ncbi:MAG: HU family DNA-binding protein [Gammaproteobacteria bacterium]|nr:HU family DNA-binding protein [Gammaproteobacteria bacterium]MXY65796.1 DNA-binding protein [Gammaproteobacteria bacterium]MYG67324.1 DNA-binding protein [Gammaproteobacteria bacterium]
MGHRALFQSAGESKLYYNPPVIRLPIILSNQTASSTMRKTYQVPLTKAQIINTLAESTGLSRKDVTSVLDGLGNLIQAHVKPRSCGIFRLPGLFRISVVKKPASKARKGVPNPFRPGETMDIAAKPASRKVRILPLKGLKDMAS